MARITAEFYVAVDENGDYYVSEENEFDDVGSGTALQIYLFSVDLPVPQVVNVKVSGVEVETPQANNLTITLE